MFVKIIVLDFDGVIVESNAIKDRAFAKIFNKYPEHYEEMMAYHHARNAVVRHEKFRYFVEDVLKLPDSSDLIDKLAKRFNNFTKQAIIECPYVTGALNFLDAVYNKYPLYLVSATPQAELEEIIEARSLNKYFKQIFGAPQKKSVVINKIMSIENILPQQTLFIGDSPEDFMTADSLGIQFIGRKSDRSIKSFDYPVFSNMQVILQYFKAYMNDPQLGVI